MNIVVVAIPTTGYIKAETTMWLLSQNATEYAVVFDMLVGQLGIDNQRNMMAKRFLTAPQATHLFFLDDDVAPPRDKDVIGQMLSYNKDIVTAAVPAYRGTRIEYSVHELLHDYDLDDPETLNRQLFRALPAQKGLRRVDGCGASCMLIRRDVLEKTPQPWFVFGEETSDGSMLGEDLYFCLNVKRAGFKIWCDWDLRCTHFKTVALDGDFVLGGS